MTATPPAMLYLGHSPHAQAIRDMVLRVADSQATVLITGESGTGKELVARALHEQSARRQGPFVPVNCGAIPRELLESELFGHRKGAFTGAHADRLGRIELAHGGTLFLDEIGDMPMDMQVKLLRVLQERCIEPVGATRAVPVEVRVVAATHRDLEAEVQAGRFREDLYYRLNVLPLRTPALRERPEDVPELLAHFAQRRALAGQAPIGFNAGFLQALMAYEWPGNVRELGNLVDRFSTLFAGQQLALSMVPAQFLPKGLVAAQQALGIEAVPLAPLADPLDLLDALAPEPVAQVCDVEDVILLAQGSASPAELPSQGLSLKDHLAGIEKALIAQALERAQGNVSQTAKLLNLQRTTLIEKINKYELRDGPLPAAG